METKSDIGLIGLAVMGQNLALNIESRGYRISVYNRTSEKTDSFIMEKAEGKNIIPFHSLEEFAESLSRPRKIIIMVKAGKPVDDTINNLVDLTEPGDLIIDGGNSHYSDTRRRFDYLESRDIRFLGTGISGGEEGALKGPSLMPGGSPGAYGMAEKILLDIAARVNGEACCAYMGPKDAGHFVKMVHNAIEYADMQLIAETYDYLRRGLGLSVSEIQKTFEDWNNGPLNSYLVEISGKILEVTDAGTDIPLVDLILDKAGQKGTGRWTSMAALEMGAPLSIIDSALSARNISSIKDQRIRASRILTGPEPANPENIQEAVKDAENSLLLSKIAAYAQGMAFLQMASDERGYALNLSSIAAIWRGGCIIRARILDSIMKACKEKPALKNLFLAEDIKKMIDQGQKGWRRTAARCIENGIPCPATAAAIVYYDSYRSENLPANLIQAQRDFFGAHTYERVDREGVFHTEW